MLLWQGVLRMGQEIEVRPGIVSRDSEGRSTCMPIYSRIVSLFAEQNELQYAVPGGLIGVGTTVSQRKGQPLLPMWICICERGFGLLIPTWHVQVDPTLTRADRLVGQVLGQVGALPDVFTELEINFFLLRRLLGVRTTVRRGAVHALCVAARCPLPIGSLPFGVTCHRAARSRARSAS